MEFERLIAKPALLIHAFVGMSAVAVAIHLALSMGKNPADAHTPKKARSRALRAACYSRITMWVTLATLITGAIVYPAFRVDVRGAWMDENAPALTGLFEIKEHTAIIGLALVIGLWAYLRRGETVVEEWSWRQQRALAWVTVAILAYCAVVGVWLVMTKSV